MGETGNIEFREMAVVCKGEEKAGGWVGYTL
jgi:hypothetical protein